MASLYTEISYSGGRATFTCHYSGLQEGYTGSRRILYSVGSSYGSQAIYGTSGSIDVTISVSSGNVYGYTFELQYKNADATEWTTAVTDRGNYTAPSIPSISSFIVSQTGIGKKTAYCSWSVSGLDSGATYEIKSPDTSGEWWTKASGSARGSGSCTITFDYFGYYSVKLVITNGNGYSDEYTTSVNMSSLEKWSWSSSNGRATAMQTSNAYSAVTGKGKVSDFSYLVWNDLCAKVKSVREAAGFPWNTTYASYNNTCMSGSDKILTATRFNSLRHNTYDQWSPVSRGDKVYGYYFTQITTQINNWINSL
jgi:hypothetical protein